MNIMNDFETNLRVVLVVILVLFLSLLLLRAYGKSKKWQDKARLTLAILFISIPAGAVLFTNGFWHFIVLSDPETIYRLGIIPFLIGIHILAATSLVLFVSWGREGLRNLNTHKEGGLIRELSNGLILGLIGVLVLGSIFGMIFRAVDPEMNIIITLLTCVSIIVLVVMSIVVLSRWLAVELIGGSIIGIASISISGLTSGIISALIYVLSFTLVVGFLVGLISEKEVREEKQRAQ